LHIGLAKTDGFKPNPGWQGLEEETAPHDGAFKFGNDFNWTGMNFGERYGRSLQEFKRVGGVLYEDAIAWEEGFEGFEDFVFLKLANREGLKEAVSEDEEKYENWGVKGDK
jgi:hypothetical protein